MVPSACQGIVGVTVRGRRYGVAASCSPAIEDPEAKAAATAERALLGALDGSCRTPIGGYARLLADGSLHLTGLVAAPMAVSCSSAASPAPRPTRRRWAATLGRSLRADSPRDLFA